MINFKISSLLKLIFVSIILVNGCKSNKPEAPIIPLEDFFQNPSKTYFKLSPDGNYISYLSSWESKLNLFVQKIDDGEPVRITNSTEGDIEKYFWASNDQIVFIKDIEGNETQRLYSVKINGGEEKDLTPFNNVRVKIIDYLKDRENQLLISFNQRDPKVFDVYNINIETGVLKMVAKNPGNIVYWLTDNEGKLRVAKISDGVNTGILYRDNENEEFQLKLVSNFKDYVEPIFFTKDNNNVYAISNLGRDKVALVKYDIKNDIELETLFEHHEVDINWVYRSNKTKKVCAVSFTTWKKELKFFCKDWEQIQKNLERNLPGKSISITSFNKKEDKVLAKAYSDKSLGEYYYYNVKTKQLTKLADIAPWFDEENMADVKPISFKARDDLTINGYLTIPNGVKAKKLPVVVYPHEGPWYRNKWMFDNKVQFLANRGYAVLQINYRGSKGYGKKFWEAGFKEWGRKMQYDITDGVNWLISQEIADPKRVAIIGKSYGGYSSLMGLANNSDLYACGVSFSGIVDIVSFLNSAPPYYEPFREMIFEMIGNPNSDKEYLQQVSPAYLVDKYKTPLLIAHGEKDQRVKKHQVDKFVAALNARKVPVTYLIQENESHTFKNEQNKFALYKELESFLAKYLKGRKEPK